MASRSKIGPIKNSITYNATSREISIFRRKFGSQLALHLFPVCNFRCAFETGAGKIGEMSGKVCGIESVLWNFYVLHRSSKNFIERIQESRSK